MKVTVGITSTWLNWDERGACRETWLSEIPDGASYVFIFGDPTAKEFECVVDDGMVVPCLDDYLHLPQKIVHLCTWFLQKTDSDYLFKCDDDTYVRLDRLVKMPVGMHYCGGRISRDRPYASGGAGYLLSREAAMIVANMPEKTGAEDRLVGMYLAHAGINPVFDPRFCWNEAKWPTPDNEVISTHYCSPDRLRDLHRANWS